MEERSPGDWTEGRGLTVELKRYVDCDPAVVSATDAEKKCRISYNYFAVNPLTTHSSLFCAFTVGNV